VGAPSWSRCRGEPMNANPSRRDQLARVLAKHFGAVPDDFDADALKIDLSDLFQLNDPRAAEDRAQRVADATRQIELAVASMTQPERASLDIGFALSPHRPRLPRATAPTGELILQLVRAMRDGAKRALQDVKTAAAHAPAASLNADRRARGVAVQVSAIYERRTGKAPPKAGLDGPFQRLLRDVFMEMDIQVDDLRGALAAVHEFRKNREVAS